MLNLVTRSEAFTLEDLISETKITWALVELIILARWHIFSLLKFLPIPWQFQPNAFIIVHGGLHFWF
jgi:hypothetical protein